MLCMSASVTVITDSGEQSFECGSILTIGRVEQNDIPIPDPKVSRNHAAIRTLGDGRHYIMDMGSANGTFLNDKRVVSPLALGDGDSIAIGGAKVIFRCDEPDEATKKVQRPDQQTLVTFGVQMKKITVLVSDIIGYTDLSSKADPDLLSSVLGAWCRAVSDATEKHGGVVDKFIGDAVMVRWVTEGAELESSMLSALKLSHDIKVATDAINQSFPDLPTPLSVGVGINTGQAILGSVGGSTRRDYTAIGDTVNIAFRLESATRTLECDVVVGEASYKHLPSEIWEGKVHEVMVKGKDKPLTVSALTFDDIAEI
jgi:adenylate cyclase